ncbi:MAG: hypothetical protein LJE70_15115 [Chromatiaceae bacterium]|nr:hypothetical protein [Chromatiaceae bacterium]
MNSEDLNRKLQNLESKLAEVQRAVEALKGNDKALYQNDKNAHEQLEHLRGVVKKSLEDFADTGNKVKDATDRAVKNLQQQITGIYVVNSIIFQALLADQTFAKQASCLALQMMLEKVDEQEKPLLAMTIRGFLDSCDKANQPLDAKEVVEKAKPHLRIVDADYFKDEEN